MESQKKALSGGLAEINYCILSWAFLNSCSQRLRLSCMESQKTVLSRGQAQVHIALLALYLGFSCTAFQLAVLLLFLEGRPVTNLVVRNVVHWSQCTGVGPLERLKWRGRWSPRFRGKFREQAFAKLSTTARVNSSKSICSLLLIPRCWA